MRSEIETVRVQVLPDGRMDVRNASIYLGSSEKTLAMMRCSGTGPKFIKPAGRIFYYQENLDEWLQSNGRVVSTAQAERPKNTERPADAS